MSQYNVDELGRSLPQFADFELLGEGSFGAVYSVWDRTIHNFVALKLMRDENDGTSKRFEKEYAILKQSNHPRLVLVYSSGWCQVRLANDSIVKHFWYTMEKCSSSLADKISTLQLDERIRIGLHVLDGLAYLHEKGIAHRDIKPENIFLTKFGGVRIGDFGLVKRAAASDTSLTPKGVALGTPRYLAPERWEGQKETAEDWRPSDQYAAGLTLYELLSCGGFPLDLGDGSLMSTCHAHLVSLVNPVTVHEHPNRSFPELDAVIGRMLKKKPSARYRSLSTCKIDLVGALAHCALYND